MLISVVAGVSIDAQIRVGLSILWDFAVIVSCCRIFALQTDLLWDEDLLFVLGLQDPYSVSKLWLLPHPGLSDRALSYLPFIPYVLQVPCPVIFFHLVDALLLQLFNFPNRFFISIELGLFLRVTSSNPRRQSLHCDRDVGVSV
jgi:hypothetical protein